MGVQIAHIYGGSYMLNIYLAGALAGSLGHMAYCAILVPWIEVQIFEKYDYVRLLSTCIRTSQIFRLKICQLSLQETKLFAAFFNHKEYGL